MARILTVIALIGFLSLDALGQVHPKKVVPIEQPPEELDLISRFADSDYSFNDLLRLARKLERESNEANVKVVLGKYVATLERMVQAKKEKKKQDEIRELVLRLRDQQDFAFFLAHGQESPASKLFAKGKAAIPFLIEELENDDLTRSVSVAVTRKETIPQIHVLRIGDCACGILRKITGQNFGDAWYIHKGNGKMSPKDVRDQASKWYAQEKVGLSEKKFEK